MSAFSTYKQFAPIAFKNVAETFSDEDVVYWKGRAEKYFTDYVKPKLSEAGEADSSFVSSTATTETNTTSVATGDDMPF